MGIFTSLLNNIKYRSIQSIDKDKEFAFAQHKQAIDGYALLKKGKLIADNLAWVSQNLLSKGKEEDQQEFLYAQALNGKYLVFNADGKCLTPDGLLIFNTHATVDRQYPLFYGVDDEFGEIVVKSNFDKKQFILYPDKQKISPTYISISNYDENEHRMIQYPTRFCYYINRNGEYTSNLFVNETGEADSNGNKIQTTINSKGDDTQVLVDSKHRWISHFYEQIVPMGQYYIGTRKNGKIMHKLDSQGNILGETTKKDINKIYIESEKRPTPSIFEQSNSEQSERQ